MFKELNPPKPIRGIDDLKNMTNKPAGLGDQIERLAQPVARAIDKTLKTNVRNCGGCKRRRDYLNKKFPSRDA